MAWKLVFSQTLFLSKKQKTTPTLFLEDKINLKIILYYQKRLNHNILIINNQKNLHVVSLSRLCYSVLTHILDKTINNDRSKKYGLL